MRSAGPGSDGARGGIHRTGNARRQLRTYQVRSPSFGTHQAFIGEGSARRQSDSRTELGEKTHSLCFTGIHMLWCLWIVTKGGKNYKQLYSNIHPPGTNWY